MKGETKEISFFAIPLFLGAYASSLIIDFSYSYTHLTTSACFFILILTAISLFRQDNIHKVRIHIAAAALITGYFCYLSGYIADIFSSGSNISESWGLWMQQSVDRIPFADKENNALLKALLTGNRSDLSIKTIENFRSSGASHILALSGLHLGIIYGIISKMTSIIGNSLTARRFRAAITIVLCSIYTMATGAGPSIMRAVIFICVNEICRLSHREASLLNVLFVALIIQITISPKDITSIGFQLSYCAVSGIAIIYPYLEKMYGAHKNDPLKKVWNMAALSISCQITTAPLAWIYFKTFPQYFLITNLIAIPLTTILIPIGLLTTLLEIADICPTLVVTVSESLLNTLRYCLEIIAAM